MLQKAELDRSSFFVLQGNIAAHYKPEGNMELNPRTLAAWAFPAATLMASTGALAQQLPPLALALTGQLSSVVLTPQTAYVIGSSPLVWNTILGAFGPAVKPYSEGLRMLTIKQAIRLRPVPMAPTPPAEIFANSYSQAISFGDSMRSE